MNNQATKRETVVKRKKKSQFKDIWRRFKKSKTAVLGLWIFLAIVLCTVFADIIAPSSVAMEQNMAARMQGPSAEHWFGTDMFGRDLFARVIQGTRYSFIFGLICVAIGIGLGCLFGASAGFLGGRIDSIIMRIMDVLICIPYMVLAISIAGAMGAGLTSVLVAIIVTNVPYYARLIRSAILNVTGMDYIEAARTCGASNAQIILKHVLPNAIGPVIVQATMSVGAVIINAAGLSFLGVGIQPPAPEWGAMLSEGQNYMLYYPHMVIFPGLAIALTAFSMNLMGDGLRDALDPKLKD